MRRLVGEVLAIFRGHERQDHFQLHARLERHRRGETISSFGQRGNQPQRLAPGRIEAARAGLGQRALDCRDRFADTVGDGLDVFDPIAPVANDANAVAERGVRRG